MIHGLWLPLLGLGVHRNDQAVHQGQLPPAVNLKQVSKGPSHPEIHLPLPSAWLLSSVTEKAYDGTQVV